MEVVYRYHLSQNGGIMADNWLTKTFALVNREVRSWPTRLQLAAPAARYRWSNCVARLKAEHPSLAAEIDAMPEEVYRGGYAADLMRAEWKAHLDDHRQITSDE